MFEALKEILIKQLHIKDKEVLPTSRIKEDLGADSLDILELLMTVEEEHGIVIPDDQLINFVTVGDVAAYLESRK